MSDERIYPCVDCGVMRSKAAVFTVCDICWIRRHPVGATCATEAKLSEYTAAYAYLEGRSEGTIPEVLKRWDTDRDSLRAENEALRAELAGAQGELLGLRVSEAFFRNRADVLEASTVRTLSQRERESMQGCCPLCALGPHDYLAESERQANAARRTADEYAKDAHEYRAESISLRARVAEQDEHIANLINTVRQHERNRESMKAIRVERDSAIEQRNRYMAMEGELNCAEHDRDVAQATCKRLLSALNRTESERIKACALTEAAEAARERLWALLRETIGIAKEWALPYAPMLDCRPVEDRLQAIEKEAENA